MISVPQKITEVLVDRHPIEISVRVGNTIDRVESSIHGRQHLQSTHETTQFGKVSNWPHDTPAAHATDVCCAVDESCCAVAVFASQASLIM